MPYNGEWIEITPQRVAIQLDHTNSLLDKYVRILSKSEDVTRLIMDERWQGAEAVSHHIARHSCLADSCPRTRRLSSKNVKRQSSVRVAKRKSADYPNNENESGRSKNAKSTRSARSANDSSENGMKRLSRREEAVVSEE